MKERKELVCAYEQLPNMQLMLLGACKGKVRTKQQLVQGLAHFTVLCAETLFPSPIFLPLNTKPSLGQPWGGWPGPGMGDMVSARCSCRREDFPCPPHCPENIHVPSAITCKREAGPCSSPGGDVSITHLLAQVRKTSVPCCELQN